MKLWVKILIAMALGGATGYYMGPEAAVLRPLGTAFLNLINMIIVLLVLASMTVGVASIHDPKKLGRVGSKTLLFYLVTTVISICIGLAFASFFKPGAGLNLTAPISLNTIETPSVTETLLSIIPTNPISSMVSGNVLQVIVFALFLGVSISFAGERGRPLLEFLESLADVMYKMTSLIMEFSPIGVYAFMAWVVGSFGIDAITSLFKFLIIYYAACLADTIFVFCGILWGIARLHPLPFFKGMRDSLMVAFSTCSSSAALPVSMHCIQENLGVSKSISSFVLPLGSTVNMSGSAIFQAMSALFVAQAYGIELDWQTLITIVVTAVLSAVGAAGIPGTGFIMLSAVISSAGLPLEGIAMLAGIDRVREMVSTMLNVMGDAVVAVTIARQEGELDEAQYYDAQIIELEESEA
ncbi:MAG: dicarboxylate/amino acid:cation symporter [Chlamydiales bacterium]